MRVSELPSFQNWLANSPLAGDRLWNRDLEKISNTELQLFYARAGMRGLKSQAVEAIDTLQSELLLAATERDIPQAAMRVITHEPPVDRFSTDEFLDRLIKVTSGRRMAILYSLVTGQLPERTMEMMWDDARQLRQLPELAQEILRARARVQHLRVPYVFWEWATPKIAAPMLMLRESAEDAFDMKWPAIQARWTDMLWINTNAEKRGFLSLVDEVAAGKL